MLFKLFSIWRFFELFFKEAHAAFRDLKVDSRNTKRIQRKDSAKPILGLLIGFNKCKKKRNIGIDRPVDKGCIEPMMLSKGPESSTRINVFVIGGKFEIVLLA